MTFNPDIHHRNSIRLRTFDYRSAGAYFITICTFQKEPILAEIKNGETRLTALGEVVQQCWDEIPQHFPNVELDVFVVMPNHLHAIFMINEPVGATHASPDNATSSDTNRARHASPLHQSGPPKRSIGAIIGSFKSACTKRINELRDTPGLPVWQRNYHERIIRNDEEIHALRDYIRNNPARWEEDSEHPARNMGAAGNAP
jgi:REP element-mobilizing transposase RayT